MNAAVSTGLNKPELSKSFEIICAICLPISETSPFSSVKLATAIGVGATCPSVMLNCYCALDDVARRDNRKTNPIALKTINLCISKPFVIVQIYLDQI